MSAPQITGAGPTGGGTPVGGSGTPGTVAKFATSSTVTDSVIVESGGKVGVGCTDPATLIETYGTTGIRVSSDTIANVGVFQYSTDPTPATLTLRKARGTRAAQTTVATGDGLGSVNFTAYGGTGGSVLSSIAGNVVTYTSNANISSNLTFGTSAAGAATPTTRLTIDEAGVSTFTGPVRATGTAATAPAFTGSDTDTGMYFPAANQVRFSTNGSVAVAVDASQNVGFANANPATKIDVAWGDYQTIGAMRIGADVGTNTSRTDATAKFGAISVPHFTNAAANAFLIGAYANTASTTTTYIGGGLGTMNASTRVTLYTGATSTTSPGVETAYAVPAGFYLRSTSTLIFNASVTGQGVKLPATPANGDANTLDCYEEGTWTPVDRSGAGLAFTSVSGTYTRIGRTVIAQCTLTYPATANASAASFSLPIAMTTANTNFGGATIGSVGALVKNNVTALVKTGAAPATDSRIELLTYNGAGSVTNANMSGVLVVVSVCYNVA